MCQKFWSFNDFVIYWFHGNPLKQDYIFINVKVINMNTAHKIINSIATPTKKTLNASMHTTR